MDPVHSERTAGNRRSSKVVSSLAAAFPWRLLLRESDQREDPRGRGAPGHRWGTLGESFHPAVFWKWFTKAMHVFQRDGMGVNIVFPLLAPGQWGVHHWEAVGPAGDAVEPERRHPQRPPQETSGPDGPAGGVWVWKVNHMCFFLKIIHIDVMYVCMSVIIDLKVVN